MIPGSLPSLTTNAQPSRVVGRYVMYDEIACGGMATVHFGRLLGDVGFARTVAIKHLHPQFSRDMEFVSMFLDEARLASRIQHPNVVVPSDVVLLEDSQEIFLIMDYIHGETLSRLLGSARTAKISLPAAVSASIMSGALHGLHAAHEAVNERGERLNIIHRDISPHNIMVGVDGVARVLDFGVAKAASRCQSTRQGQIKGKLSYMAPEQMGPGSIDRRVDVFTAGIVLWEALTMKRLFKAEDVPNAVAKILSEPISRPSAVNPNVPLALDRVVMKALDRNVDRRFQTAREFAAAIEEVTSIATPRQVGEWVQNVCGKNIAKRSERVSQIELSSFDAASSSAPYQLLRLKQTGTSPEFVESPTKSLSQGAVEEIPPKPSEPTHDLTASSGEVLPSIIIQRPRDFWAWTRIAWPYFTGACLLAVLAVVGTVHLLRPGDGAKRAEAAPGRTVAASASAGVSPAAPPAQASVGAGPSGGAEASHSVAEGRAPSAGKAASSDVAGPRTSDANRGAEATSRRLTARPAGGKAMKTSKQADKRDCNPPFSIDSKGIRRIKPQCL